MSETSTPAAGGTTAAETVGTVDDIALRLPADGAYASILRTLTAGLAARLDFTLDDIEDLRIAVSEAAAMVLDEADPGAVLDCTFRLSTDRMELVIAADAADSSSPDYESFGWQVLATLADEAAIDTGAGRFSVRLLVRSSLAS